MKNFELPVEDKSSVLKTVRIRISLLERVEKLSASSGISVNKIINECILFALDNMKQEENKKKKK